MARSIEERYESGLDMAEDLQAYIDGRVVRAYRTGALAEVVSWCKRHRTLLMSVGVVAVLSATGTNRRRARRRRLTRKTP